MQKVIASGKAWTDTEFKADHESQFSKASDPTKFAEIKWMRASQIIKDDLVIFGEQISPDEIKQG